MPETNEKKLTLIQATSIAVGTMIGASIFSVFGLGVRIAGHNLPLVFVVSGVLALLVAYSYAILGSKIVSNAGPIEFILRGIGDNAATGALSFLFWLSYVVSLSLFARGFAGYFLPLVHLNHTASASGLVMVAVILAFVAVNLSGSSGVGKAEFFIVLVKLGILGLFVVVGLGSVREDWIVPSLRPEGLRATLQGAAIFFLSYMGFGLVTNASESIENARRNVPRAIFLSIFVVSIVYISVAVVGVGNLSLSALVKAEDYALAEAAKPFLGRFGYLLLSLGALFSISSALNATLFGGANVAYALARNGELPKVFDRKSWFAAPEGLYITAAVSIAIALLFDVRGIAPMTSAVFMVIYIFVFVAHYRLAREYGGRRSVIVLGMLAITAIFLTLQHYLWTTNRGTFWTTWALIGASFVIESVYRATSGRRFSKRHQSWLERIEGIDGAVAKRLKGAIK
jgi:amino acid transporter